MKPNERTVTVQKGQNVREVRITTHEYHPADGGGSPPAKIVVVHAGGQGRGGRKKKKQTKSLKRLERAENRVTKVGDILSGALDQGVSKYRRLRKKKAKKTKDGALVYFGDNVAKAFAKAQKKAAPALPKLLRSKKSGRKDIRNTAKALVSFIPFL